MSLLITAMEASWLGHLLGDIGVSVTFPTALIETTTVLLSSQAI